MPQQQDEFAQYARKPAAAATDEFSQYARSTPQPMPAGSFQTMPSAPVQQVSEIGAQPLQYATPGAAVSGAKARAALPQFPQQLEESKRAAAAMAPATAATLTAEGGPLAMGLSAAGAKAAFGGTPIEAAKTGAETYALGKGTELLLGVAIPKGWGFAKNLVNKAASKLADAEGAVTEAVGAQASKQAENLATFKQKATTAIQNRDQQALLAARKEALDRGAEELQPRLQQHVQDVHTSVRADLDKRWDNIRAAMTPPAGQPPILANPKAITTGVQTGSKGVAAANKELFDRVVADSFGESNPSRMEWKDIQGVYTKLGSRLAKGGLPGDVWRGLSTLQDSIGTEMETMANVQGVKGDLVSIKTDWSRYMKDFQNTRTPVTKGGSPLAHSLQAPDPGTAVKHFEGDAGDRATQTLAKYRKYGARPELAKKYRDVLDEAATAPKGGKAVTMPKLKTEPPVDTEAIRKEAIRKGKRKLAIGALGAAGAGAAGAIGYDIYHGGGSPAPLP